MRQFFLRMNLIAALLAGCLLTACVTVVRQLPESEKTSTEQGAPYEMAEKVLVSVLKNDPDAFESLLAPELKKEFDKKEFEASLKKVIDTLGEPVSYQFMTKLELDPLSPYIWKIRCRKINSETKEDVFKDVLFRVIIGTTAKGPIVMAYNFL